MRLTQRLEQRLVLKPHSPIRNPCLTGQAKDLEGNLDDILEKRKLSNYEKMLQIESILLSKGEFKDSWRDYLDATFMAHSDAALQLRNRYDAVVGIKSAGVYYAKIFEMMGFPMFEIDYSHHRRKMDKPIIEENQIRELKQKKNVLVTNIDFITGKTLTEVAKYLREKEVNVNGAYIGLSRWPGMDSNDFFINNDKVNFKTFWKSISSCSGLKMLRNEIPYEKGIRPKYLRLYSVNSSLEKNEKSGVLVARKVAKYLKQIGK